MGVLTALKFALEHVLVILLDVSADGLVEQGFHLLLRVVLGSGLWDG